MTEGTDPGASDRLSGRVAVVTGGGSGIGRASTVLLARAGASVVVVDVDGDAARAAAATVGGLAVPGDVSRPDTWGTVVDRATERFGGIDVAHLNAGVVTGEVDITAVTDAQYRRAVGVNVDGVVFGIRSLVPVMEARGGGAIVATASMAGLIGYSPDPIYGLTKSAVVGLVRALVPQLRDRHVTVNAVCPAYVDTPMLGAARELLEGGGFPLIRPEEVAEVALDCLSGGDTGQVMVVQPGSEVVPFRFARPPGPRAPGMDGRLPPGELAAHDQARGRGPEG